MAEKSIKRRIGAMPSKADAREVRPLLDAVLTDLTELRTELAAAVADVKRVAGALDTLATKLNADAGVTDTNYATGNSAAITAATPGALTLTE